MVIDTFWKNLFVGYIRIRDNFNNGRKTLYIKAYVHILDMLSDTTLSQRYSRVPSLNLCLTML